MVQVVSVARRLNLLEITLLLVSFEVIPSQSPGGSIYSKLIPHIDFTAKKIVSVARRLNLLEIKVIWSV